jgi:hypothetical protein
MTGTLAALAVLTPTALSPDHDGAGGLAAGKGDDAGQVARVGLGNG